MSSLRAFLLAVLAVSPLSVQAAGDHLPYNPALVRQAQAGDASAQFHLGMCYADETSKPYSLSEAVKWFRKAAEQGHVDAQFRLGTCYYFGKGVRKNEGEAAKWYHRAAQQGHVWARKALHGMGR